MARRKGRRSQVRSPSKTMEKELVQKAERLAKDPGLVLPKVVPPCAKDPFEKILRRMERIARFADDEEKLKKLASGGDQIIRAYAGTLMLKAAGKAPYLASLKLPDGEVFVAMRGKARKEKLAGMQWFDHPVYRLLLYIDLALKRPHFHFYSTKDTLYCSCREPNPPEDYIEFVMQQPRVNVTETAEGVWTCPHLDVGTVERGEAVDGTYLRVRWRSAGIVLGVCRRCARTGHESTLGALTRHMAIPSIESDFHVSVHHRLKGAEECPLWDDLASMPVDRSALDDYDKGKLEDVELIDRHIEAINDRIRDHRGPHFILGDRCFCDDASAFVESLNPSDEERLALEAILPSLDRPLILERATPAKVLAELWDEHGEDALRAVVGGDEELLVKYIDQPDATASPSQVLKRALVESRQRTIISRLPQYGRLPAIASFADKVARAYKTEGPDGALRKLDKERGSDTKVKSVAYSFLLVLGREASKQWQYDKTEMDFASFLSERAKALLEAEPDDYHGALQALLSATGSTERIPEPRGGE